MGDIHGQFYDMLKIFELNGIPSENNPYLFNGDFVDRGHFSIEVIITILVLKLTYPEHVHLNRGNHEDAPYNTMYGFYVECCDKYDDESFEFFNEVFSYLPMVYRIKTDNKEGDRQVAVMHGGCYENFEHYTLDDVKIFDRKRDYPEDATEVLD